MPTHPLPWTSGETTNGGDRLLEIKKSIIKTFQLSCPKAVCCFFLLFLFFVNFVVVVSFYFAFVCLDFSRFFCHILLREFNVCYNMM